MNNEKTVWEEFKGRFEYSTMTIATYEEIKAFIRSHFVSKEELCEQSVVVEGMVSHKEGDEDVLYIAVKKFPPMKESGIFRIISDALLNEQTP